MLILRGLQAEKRSLLRALPVSFAPANTCAGNICSSLRAFASQKTIRTVRRGGGKRSPLETKHDEGVVAHHAERHGKKRACPPIGTGMLRQFVELLGCLLLRLLGRGLLRRSRLLGRCLLRRSRLLSRSRLLGGRLLSRCRLAALLRARLLRRSLLRRSRLLGGSLLRCSHFCTLSFVH